MTIKHPALEMPDETAAGYLLPAAADGYNRLYSPVTLTVIAQYPDVETGDYVKS